MQITLSPEREAVIERDIASGRYASVDDYIAEAITLLHNVRGESPEELQMSLEAAWQEAERGELMDEDEVRQEMQKMKTDFLTRKSAA